jgi:hypothetical protein
MYLRAASRCSQCALRKLTEERFVGIEIFDVPKWRKEEGSFFADCRRFDEDFAG